MKYLGVIAVFLGIGLNKYIINTYGEGSSSVVITITLSIAFFIIGWSIYKKYYLGAIACLSFLIPITIMAIGLFINKLYLGIIGFVLLLVLCPLAAKMIRKYKDNTYS